jgi:hypothetical protein
MTRDRIQTRADDDMIERIDAYADDEDVSRAEALRRLLRAGLIREGYLTPVDEIEAQYGSTAHMDPRVRVAGGALIGLALLFLVLAELGLV